MIDQRKATSAANAFIVIGAFFTYSWNPLVAGAGQFLIDPDTPTRSDLIFLLGGDYPVRAPLAASLFRSGYGAAILLARGPQTFNNETIDLLVSLAVPKYRIVDYQPGQGVRNTADEARVLRQYVDSHPVTSVLVVTSALHSRRARMAICRSLWLTHVQVRVVCAGRSQYSNRDKTDAKLEWTKLIYYFFTFFG